jgi:hypothetical protein
MPTGEPACGGVHHLLGKNVPEEFMKNVKGVVTLCIALLVLTMTACPKRTTIADIKLDPARYRDKEVAIAGRVTQSFGAFTQGVYEIDDGTGRLWILSEKLGAPSQGAAVGVTGRLVTGITFAGRNYGTILRESQRRTRS